MSRTTTESPTVPDPAGDAGPPTPDAGPPALTPRPAPRRRYSTAVLVAGVVAALLAGFAVGALATRPAALPADDSAEAGFARDMITHHNQAVTMGLIAYRDAATPEVQQLGYDIATIQQGQIGMMHQWLRDWGLPPTSMEPAMAWMPDGDKFGGSPMPGMASPEQMEELRQAEDTELDTLFLELMITHHLGGIHMVDGVRRLSDDAEVRWLAELMKEGQQLELEVMRNLLIELEAESGEES